MTKQEEPIHMPQKCHIDMTPVKRFAAERLPDCPLRDILLLEEDKLDAQTFLARFPVWLKLVRILER